MEEAQRLLSAPRPEVITRENLKYYQQEWPLPVPGEILTLVCSNQELYYALVVRVENNESVGGKDSLIYHTFSLGQRGMAIGMSPFQITSRNDLELKPKIIRVRPKDRKRWLKITLTQL